MDRKALVKNLRSAFSKNEVRDKYSKVWLSYIDFGGIYHTDKTFELNVEPKHKVTRLLTEISYVFDFLRSNANEVVKQIWAVNVHRSEVDLYDVRNDMIIYAEAEQE